jgi:hypothetical protein
MAQKSKRIFKKRFKKSNYVTSIYQEYEQLEEKSQSKKFSFKKRILLAGLILIAGSFTHTKLFDSSAAPVNDKDSKKVVSCAYSTFFGRVPDRGGEKYWQERYERTNYNAIDLARGLLYSREGARVANQSGFDEFIYRMYESCLQRGAPPQDVAQWRAQNKNGMSKEEIFNFIIKLGDKPVVFPKEEKCKTYSKGGSVTPICKSGSKGTAVDVVTITLPGTNIVVNKAWQKNVENFRTSALKSGFNLQSYTDPTLAAKAQKQCGSNLLKSPGSFRSSADQACLTKLGYPTATGTSMHQWGLAMDLTCNGIPLAQANSCQKWVKSNAGKFGIANKTNEVWHWSSTGN